MHRPTMALVGPIITTTYFSDDIGYNIYFVIEITITVGPMPFQSVK